MKIAAFNVENLFDRTKVFNQDDNSLTKQISNAVNELNLLFEKEIYTQEIKDRIVILLTELGLAKTDESKYVIFRIIRGKFLARPKGKPIEIVAAGRERWIGWLEMKTEPVNAIAILNTGRVIRDVDADILAVIEAEDRVSLKMFSEHVLKAVDGQPYTEIMLIDGNDTRGIDVGIMTKKGFSIGAIRSHIHLLKNGKPVFSRDSPEYCVTTPAGESFWIIPNHFKSKFGGDDPASKAKRKAQASEVAKIYNRLRREAIPILLYLAT